MNLLDVAAALIALASGAAVVALGIPLLVIGIYFAASAAGWVLIARDSARRRKQQ